MILLNQRKVALQQNKNRLCRYFRPPGMGVLIGLLLLLTQLPAQQITLPRVEQMPNLPVPYSMRDWKEVARGYDSLVFNFNLTGEYLPLIWWRTQTVNYPEHQSFGLHTVVGTTYPNSAEAINVLPAVISATLVGIDKSNQNGYNWALMCEEYFNRRPEENVYLNHPVTSSGSDWWYDTMPNLFFYQLYDLYPGTGHFEEQFTTVANRWLEAVKKMGASATPWRLPNMNYRGWYLASMTPNTSGVAEPEAAGAIAWLLYMAYVKTGHSEYRIGAEWAMEFLNQQSNNPAYELQLPYGTYLAARMNAELGTSYDVEKLLNWCFNPEDNVRNWGVTLGNWGGYDCYGLVGEARYTGYAFAMNTFEQVGALVPLVRYDDRFARAIGKWVLNAANAARLFYPNYLPDTNQDSEEWSHQYDPRAYIAHEALREDYYGIRPYATGDAISGGWGKTNLALYGSSHVGIFGGIIDTTEVAGILRLDLLRTDYFHAAAYPTYLFYNPFLTDTMVTLSTGSGTHDIYDAVANRFLLEGVSGTVSLTIPADGVLLAVITPSGGTREYRLNQLLVNGVVVDYRSGVTVSNYPPRIKSLAAEPDTVAVDGSLTLYCTATDRETALLHYLWQASDGVLTGEGATVQWTAPPQAGVYQISVQVQDEGGLQDSAAVTVVVVEKINQPPTINELRATPRKIDLGGTSRLLCRASDPDGDSLTFSWSAAGGRLTSRDSTAEWTAPDTAGNYWIYCTVRDNSGASKRDSVVILVRDFTRFPTGRLIAYYPFNGDARDRSGNGHDGIVYEAALTVDRLGLPNSAFWFDGVDDRITIPNDPELNFGQAITINFWLRVEKFFDREAYPLSHGNWENRWKISVTNQRLRWTIKTDIAANSGIKDLDSRSALELFRYYNVTVFYDGADCEIYLDGELDNFTTWSGRLLPTNYDLTIGQVLPGNNNYNFKGVIDDIRIYDYPLTPPEIRQLYEQGLTEIQAGRETVIREFDLSIYPNPFNQTAVIRFTLPTRQRVEVTIFDLLGRRVARLADRIFPAGEHRLSWNARGLSSGIYLCRIRAGNDRATRKILLLR